MTDLRTDTRLQRTAVRLWWRPPYLSSGTRNMATCTANMGVVQPTNSSDVATSIRVTASSRLAALLSLLLLLLLLPPGGPAEEAEEEDCWRHLAAEWSLAAVTARFNKISKRLFFT